MRILVVEDREEISSFIKKGLKEEGYAVDVACDGVEGFYFASIYPYDLFILDVMMPKKNGFELLEDLRKNDIKKPILMLTVLGDTKEKVRGLNAGADDYLVKPFSFAELLARIRALLRRNTLTSSPVLHLEDLTIDPVEHRVTREKRNIHLSQREFSLLLFLMRNSNRVVSRTSIIEHVWDMNFDSDTNLVDVYIRHLRQKIDEDFSLKLIHTVRGYGYRLGELKK
ncbi:MAG: heavy metal response regulator transcription factor [Verrucomicrobiota bacterium]|nr:heavy metal response regulator transcription factor [Verrucomicrobiota bacterium]